MSDTLTITETCAGRLRELLDGAAPAAGLRIDVVQGGCSGHQYRLALDEASGDDVVTEAHGVRVFTSPANLRFVGGSTVDHRADGFHIENPNVVYGCGCGNSFVLRDEAEAIA
jgi:iron-sulfur cluster assembly protein